MSIKKASTIILLGGGTACGKTTIAKAFAEKYEALVLHHDRYYKDIPHPEGYNFDEPDALDNALLIEHLKQLRDGQPIQAPIYDFPSHKRLLETELIVPHPLIIIEGILCLSIREIRSLGDFLIYVDAPDDIRLARRLTRDVVSRGRSVESVLKQYMRTVRPMHLQHVLPSRQYASLYLDGTAPLEDNIFQMAKHLNLP